MARFLCFFAREPDREAREKGFTEPEAADFFAAIAAGWHEAARRAGATLVVAAPPEDLPAWRRRLKGEEGLLWIAQRGGSFGERLENTARRAAGLGGRSILVGGDVLPSARELLEGFEALESGVDAALAPSPDGGVWLIGLTSGDLDLLSGIAIRRRDVFARLLSALAGRGRRVRLLALAPDVDGRSGLRAMARADLEAQALASLARRILSLVSFDATRTGLARPAERPRAFARWRAPPRAA